MTTYDDLMALAPDAPLSADAARELAGAALEGASTSVRDVPQGSSAKRTSRRDVPGAPRRAVVAIGAFDGVHRGHRALVERARAEAEARGDELVVVTFDPDPAEVLAGPQARATLLPTAERARALASLAGVDEVVTLDFTPELAALPFERFVREVLGGICGLDAIVVGEDFHMGAGGAGDVAALAALGARDGFDVVGVRLADEGGEPITATRVRALVRAGRVERAADLLGRCHRAGGTVVHGRGEGTSFGFPTANVALPDALCVPDQGVYAGFVVAGRTAWPAALNVGAPPSFSPSSSAPRSLIEANLMGFSGDLYGREVEVVFARWLRDSRPFDSLGELERTVLGNIDWVRAALGDGALELGEVGA